MSDRTLEIDRIGKRFGPVTALDEISADVPPGAVFGLVGGSGAGKTTLLRIVLGLLAHDTGEVRFAGRTLTHEARAAFGYLPAERGLYPKMTVLDHLVYLARLRGFSLNAAHRGARQWTGRLGLASRAGTPVGKLGLEERQRVQLAAALVHDPAVLVLDEPFSGLTPSVADVLDEVLRDKAVSEIPVLLSGRRFDVLERVCSRAGILHEGRMVVSGPLAELTGGATARISVSIDAAAPEWAARVPGVRVLSQEADGHGGGPDGTMTTVVELAPGTDDQSVLHAALAAGPVRDFRRHRMSLEELYRAVVAGTGGDDGGDTDPSGPTRGPSGGHGDSTSHRGEVVTDGAGSGDTGSGDAGAAG